MEKYKYIKIGDIVVDGARIIVLDPIYFEENKKLIENSNNEIATNNSLFQKIPLFVDKLSVNKNDIPCKAIIFNTRGDGVYEVFGKIEKDKNLGEILTEIKIKIN
ncbi:MAG: hypothetical protein CVT88_04855 [Candidatus Altiarchaeales archaeon HGW-Altiarchaeales-1]|nr:MAG: hypothetical protein CVT89_05060 [Candidatus Altiarchaeales archaeon HGW-Altiarchaeales-2]PKP59691.1 MAG: hypothetical protein CVT88_04855 [Candidatus Altiarchaeales archaeon HGW-Altiarchaeales-1]